MPTTRQVSDIRVGSEGLGDVARRLDLADLNEAVARLGDSAADGLGALGLALSADDVGLALLLGALDDETGALGVLLGDLLLLDGLGELLAEGHVGDGDVLESDVELAGALHEVGADALGDGLALGDELGGVELGHDGLEDLVADGGEHALVVVRAQVLVDLGQGRHVRPVQHPQRQAHHLHVLRPRRRRDVPRLRPHVEHDAPLQPRHQEVRPLPHHRLLHPLQPVEDHRPRPALHVVERRLHRRDADRRWDRPPVYVEEGVGHFFDFFFLSVSVSVSSFRVGFTMVRIPGTVGRDEERNL